MALDSLPQSDLTYFNSDLDKLYIAISSGGSVQQKVNTANARYGRSNLPGRNPVGRNPMDVGPAELQRLVKGAKNITLEVEASTQVSKVPRILSLEMSYHSSEKVNIAAFRSWVTLYITACRRTTDGSASPHMVFNGKAEVTNLLVGTDMVTVQFVTGQPPSSASRYVTDRPHPYVGK